MTKTFKSHGIEYEFEDDTDEVMNALKEAEWRGMLGVAIQAEGDAKELITKEDIVDTGRFRNSITYAFERDEETLDVYIGSIVEYAPIIEFGAHYTNPNRKDRKATHVLQRSVTNNREKYRKLLVDALENA